MKIIVFGASGKTGHEVVQLALQNGHDVTAFVRNPSRLNIVHDHLHITTGDITDYEQVAVSMIGKEAVISALGATSPFKYDQDVVDGVGNIIRAMEVKDVRRFIYMSFVGVKESRHSAGLVIRYIAPRLLSTEIKGHEQRENLIRNSTLDYTIVRSPTLTNGKQTAQYKTGEELSKKGFINSISRADVAHFLVQQLTDVTYLKKAPRIMYA